MIADTGKRDYFISNIYRKDLCTSRTFLIKSLGKNHGCGFCTRPLLSEGVNWLVGVTNCMFCIVLFPFKFYCFLSTVWALAIKMSQRIGKLIKKKLLKGIFKVD